MASPRMGAAVAGNWCRSTRRLAQRRQPPWRPLARSSQRPCQAQAVGLGRRRAFHSSPPGRSTSASSVSQAEVSHFSRLASSWWDPHGPSRLLHLMNPLRHDFIHSCVQYSVDDARPATSYLDVGCGGGIFASSAARLPTTSTVTAIDPTPQVIEVAKSKQRCDPAIGPPKLQYRNCAIEDLPVPDRSHDKVDVLTLFEVLEHVATPSAFLDTAIRHVKPGGWIVGSTIARSPLAYLTTKLVAEAPVIGLVPRGTHDFDKYINPSELRDFFQGRAMGSWGPFRTQGVMYIPLLGWRLVDRSEDFGNYFFGIQKLD